MGLKGTNDATRHVCAPRRRGLEHARLSSTRTVMRKVRPALSLSKAPGLLLQGRVRRRRRQAADESAERGAAAAVEQMHDRVQHLLSERAVAEELVASQRHRTRALGAHLEGHLVRVRRVRVRHILRGT